MAEQTDSKNESDNLPSLAKEDFEFMVNSLFKKYVANQTSALEKKREKEQKKQEQFERKERLRELKPGFLAEEILNNFEIMTMSDNDEIYIYNENDGLWKPEGISKLRSFLQNHIGNEEVGKNIIEEAIYMVKCKTYKNRSIFDLSYEFIACNNGVFNLKNHNFENFRGDHYLLSKIKADYNPEAKCPEINKFLNSIVYPDDVETLYEWAAFCLYKRNIYQKMFIALGEPGTGKSQYLSLLENFLGKDENVSNATIQDIIYDKFAAADLYGKMANIYADLSKNALHDTGRIKAITSGVDSIRAQFKFKNGFKFVPFAKLTFSCNKLPELEDLNDYAFFDRLILITFPFRFRGTDKEVHNLSELLTTKEELSGFLNECLKRLEEMTKNKGFSKRYMVEQTREIYIRSSDIVGSFVLDMIEEDHEYVIPKEELYNIFSKYCIDKGVSTMSMDLFGKKLRSKISVSDSRPTIDNKRIMVWDGIKITPTKSNSCHKVKPISTLEEIRKINIYKKNKNGSISLIDNCSDLVAEENSKLMEGGSDDHPELPSMSEIFQEKDDITWSEIESHFTTFDEADKTIKKWIAEGKIFESRPGWYRRL